MSLFYDRLIFEDTGLYVVAYISLSHWGLCVFRKEKNVLCPVTGRACGGLQCDPPTWCERRWRCPKIGASQWTCTREECTCHRKAYAHAEWCTYRSGGWTALGQCNCGAKRD